MIVTLKWLSEYVDLENVSLNDIVNKFIQIGYEVEEIKELSKGMERVVIGKIIKLQKHPNADKLQICTISLGGGQQVQILTAATNVFEGAMVPCALDGADLPNGVKIKTTNMRGEESQGMLCSGQELCIDDSVYRTASVDGIMILDNTAREGQKIAEFLGLDDVVLDLKVLPNRPDCQSVVGLAKELAIGLGIRFRAPSFEYKSKSDSNINVELQTKNCPTYLTATIKDVILQESPSFIKQRLKAVGINPKNNLVDLTNYVLYEIGQPLHAFDYDKLTSNKIIVRTAKDKETILGLDNKEHELSPQITVIADSNSAIGIAGIMGGKDFSVSDGTKNIVLESAIFDRVNIRRGSRSLGLRTDASARYERGIEQITALYGMNRYLSLVEKLGIGKICKPKLYGSINENKKVIDFDINKVKQTLGVEIPTDKIIEILNSLDIETKIVGSVIKCKIPLIRGDLELQADLMEEIIRFYGFDKITPTHCEKTASIAGGLSESILLEDLLTNTIMSTGANQVRTFTFRSPKDMDKLLLANDDSLRNCVNISNPLSLDYSTMRTQMLSSLLDVISVNESRKITNINIFEIGKVFFNTQENGDVLPTENKIFAYASTLKTDFFETKAILEGISNRLGVTFKYLPTKKNFMHPNICADVVMGNRVVGFIGKVHPQVTKNFDIKQDCYYFELNLNMLPAKKTKKAKPTVKYPASYRDLAIVINKDVLVGGVIESIKKAGGNILEDAQLFDIYEGDQIDKTQKSVAFNLVFRKQDGTLTQEEVNDAFDKILEKVEKDFGAKIRA